MHNFRKLQSFWYSHCSIFLCALVLILACHRAPEPGPNRVSQATGVVVTPAKPQRKNFVRLIELPGRVVAIETTPLHAKVTGFVQSINVDIGDRITGPNGKEPGAVLCELLVPELVEELHEKEALVKQAEAQVTQGEAGIHVADASLRSAKAKLQEAIASAAKEDSLLARWKSEYERVSKLSDEGVVTKKVAEEAKSELQAAEAGREEANAKITSAEALLQESEAGLVKAKADLTAIQSRLAVAEAERRRLESLVEYSKIRAPFDGVVVERRVHTGHLVQAGATSGDYLFSVMRIDPIRLSIDVPEAEAALISKGSKVRFRPPGSSGDPVEATISRTGWSLSNTSRTLLAEVEVANPEGLWRPGAYHSVTLVVAEVPDAVCIPKTAIFTQEKQVFCYVIDEDGRLRMQKLTLGLASGDEWQVKEGLTGDEQIIARNVGAFREGQKVEIAAPAP
jgi:HlyD family secretion protein